MKMKKNSLSNLNKIVRCFIATLSENILPTRSMERGMSMEQIELPSSQMVWVWRRTHMDPSISNLANLNHKTMQHQQELQNWGMISSIEL